MKDDKEFCDRVHITRTNDDEVLVEWFRPKDTDHCVYKRAGNFRVGETIKLEMYVR